MDNASYPDPDGLYRRHSSVVYSYVRCHVRFLQDAEDLTAETFEAAIRGAATFSRSRGTERAWLLGIAHNQLVRFLRIRSRTVEVHGDLDRLTSPLAEPEERLLLSERRVEILEAIGTLPLRDRHAITLRYIAELRAREVATLLGVSRPHLEVILHRARRRLSRYLTASNQSTEGRSEIIDHA